MLQIHSISLGGRRYRAAQYIYNLFLETETKVPKQIYLAGFLNQEVNLNETDG